MTTARILVLNAGSSSLKAALVVGPDRTDWRSAVDWGSAASSADRAAALGRLLHAMNEQSAMSAGAGTGVAIDAVAHRVVHGGSLFNGPVRLDDQVVGAIRDTSDLAPLHNDVALETIVAARRALPGVPHVASFDTAFHATLPPEGARYAVPERWFAEWGVRRYGFHGLSVAWSTERAAELLERDPAGLALVVAHLGSGASVTAVDGGRSVDTSMGMTPLEGLMMGTRSGSLDPGVPLHLIERGLLDVGEVRRDLERRSGLLGVSGSSADVRKLQTAADGGDERARLALVMFERRAAAAIAAAATALPRLDALVFTGGIGEHSHRMRQGIASRLRVVGVAAPPAQESDPPDGDHIVSGPTDPVSVLRIEAREDLVIAREAAALILG